MTEQSGCADCGRLPVDNGGLCASHRAQYEGMEPFDRDVPLIGDECPCVACQSDMAEIFPCMG